MGKVIKLSSKDGSLGIGPDGLIYLTAQIDGVKTGDRLKIDDKVFEVKHIEYYLAPPEMFVAEIVGVAS
jgi:hypothetical protein